MRKLALMAVLASTAMATPALARDNAWYVGVEGGAMIVEDVDYDLSTPPGSTVSVDHDYGFDVDGIIGYDFGGFRVEGEVGYKRAEVDEITVPGGAFCANVACTPAGLQAGGTFDGRGNTQALSFMLNGLIDFGPDDG